MWDLGLVDTDRVGNSYIYLHLTTCGTWDLLMQTELLIAIFTYIKQVWDVGHSWSKPQSVLYMDMELTGLDTIMFFVVTHVVGPGTC